MKRWKKILLGVVGAGLISWSAAEAVTIRNGPSGNSKQENVAIALQDVLNTDGSFNTFSATTVTGATLNGTGVTTLGVGTKSSGWVIADSAEITTNGNDLVGTLATFAIPGSSTAYIVAEVIGQAPTSTHRMSFVISGTFDRDGTAAMTKVGTTTLDSDVTVGLDNVYARWEADDGSTNEVQLKVNGTDTKVQWITTVRSLTVTTTGAE